ncbi:MAG: cupredoxin domain-containing protein [Thermoplasmatota archaeon]
MRTSVPLFAAIALSLLAGCLGTGPGAVPSATPVPSGSVAPAANATGAASSTITPPPAQVAMTTSGTYPVNPGFNPPTLSLVTGANVTLTFTNADANPTAAHDWTLGGAMGIMTKEINPGEKTTLQFTAPAPGTYSYFCSTGDHRQRGMEGTLTVTHS